MSSSSNHGANVYTQSFGSAPLAALGIIPIISPRAPTSTDIQGPSGPLQLGQAWINTSAPQEYTLVAITAFNGVITATWQTSSGLPNPANFFGVVNFEGTSVVNFLSGSTVNVGAGTTWTFSNTPSFTGGFGVSAGAVNIGAAATWTFSDVPAFGNGFNVTAGTATFANTSLIDFQSGSTTGIDVGASWIFANTPSFDNGLDIGSGNLNIAGTNSKLLIAASAPAQNSVGVAALSAGTVTVSTTAVTTSSIILVTTNEIAGSQGILSVPQSSIIAGTSFVINSSNGADASSVNYLIIN